MHSLQPEEINGFRADLHTHTTCSDGSFTPRELIDHALKTGLRALSITDHDTVDAYEEATSYAKSQGILLGTGVEFSSLFKKRNVHILGYDLDVSQPFLKEFCSLQQKRRKHRNSLILEKLKRFRFVIEESELAALENHHKAIGRPHIAKIMLEKGYVKSIQDAFNIYLGDGKCCYEQGESASIDEVIDIVKEARGKVFLAHPHVINDGGIVREILTHPFDGIECYYARCAPEKVRRWLKIARERSLLISGGSDFHGTMKPHIPLGSSWVSQEEFLKIFSSHG